MDGEAHFTLNGEARVAKKGDTIVVPAGVPHSEGNTGSGDVNGVVELRPALQTKEFHEALAGLVADGKTTPRGAPRRTRCNWAPRFGTFATRAEQHRHPSGRRTCFSRRCRSWQKCSGCMPITRGGTVALEGRLRDGWPGVEWLSSSAQEIAVVQMIPGPGPFPGIGVDRSRRWAADRRQVLGPEDSPESPKMRVLRAKRGPARSTSETSGSPTNRVTRRSGPHRPVHTPSADVDLQVPLKGLQAKRCKGWQEGRPRRGNDSSGSAQRL